MGGGGGRGDVHYQLKENTAAHLSKASHHLSGQLHVFEHTFKLASEVGSTLWDKER